MLATMPTPPKSRLTQTLEEIESHSRRSMLRRATFDYKTGELAASAAAALREAGAHVNISPYGNKDTLHVSCEPPLIAPIVEKAFALGGTYSDDRGSGERTRTDNPLADRGWYQRPRGFRESLEHIEKIRGELSSMKFRIDYSYSPEGKLLLEIGTMKLVIEPPDECEEQIQEIDEMDRFVRLTQRLCDLLG